MHNLNESPLYRAAIIPLVFLCFIFLVAAGPSSGPGAKGDSLPSNVLEAVNGELKYHLSDPANRLLRSSKYSLVSNGNNTLKFSGAKKIKSEDIVSVDNSDEVIILNFKEGTSFLFEIGKKGQVVKTFIVENQNLSEAVEGRGWFDWFRRTPTPTPSTPPTTPPTVTPHPCDDGTVDLAAAGVANNAANRACCRAGYDGGHSTCSSAKIQNQGQQCIRACNAGNDSSQGI